MYELEYTTHFDAAHHLENYNGKCSNNHGHRWAVKFQITTPKLHSDMVIDFTVLKEMVDSLDHKNINEEVNFNPTAENLVKYFHDKTLSWFLSIDEVAPKIKVTVWESPKGGVSYTV